MIVAPSVDSLPHKATGSTHLLTKHAEIKRKNASR
jgi:hypothetical protein